MPTVQLLIQVTRYIFYVLSRISRFDLIRLHIQYVHRAQSEYIVQVLHAPYKLYHHDSCMVCNADLYIINIATCISLMYNPV